MKNLRILISWFILMMISCPQCWGGDTGSCGDNCRYEYNDGTLTFFPIDASKDAAITLPTDRYGLSGTVINAIVSEGITSIKQPTGYHSLIKIGQVGGKLSLPSTLTEFENDATYGMRFSTIEINSADLTIPHLSIFNTGRTGTIDIIMPASNDVEIGLIKCEGQTFNGTLNIQCKGAKQICDASLASIREIMETNGGTYHSDYYRETDSNGHVTLQYFDDGYRSLNSQGFYNVYDFSGNLTGYSNLTGTEIYDQSGTLLTRYDENGYIIDGLQARNDGSFAVLKDGKVIGFKGKRIYTVDEAVLSTQQGGKNTFKLRYR